MMYIPETGAVREVTHQHIAALLIVEVNIHHVRPNLDSTHYRDKAPNKSILLSPSFAKYFIDSSPSQHFL